VTELALDVLRHRLVLSYEALSDDITADVVLSKVLAALPVGDAPAPETLGERDEQAPASPAVASKRGPDL
jgi:hypothetical protein